jgi:hypothetical protein
VPLSFLLSFFGIYYWFISVHWKASYYKDLLDLVMFMLIPMILFLAETFLIFWDIEVLWWVIKLFFDCSLLGLKTFWRLKQELLNNDELEMRVKWFLWNKEVQMEVYCTSSTLTNLRLVCLLLTAVIKTGIYWKNL